MNNNNQNDSYNNNLDPWASNLNNNQGQQYDPWATSQNNNSPNSNQGGDQWRGKNDPWQPMPQSSGGANAPNHRPGNDNFGMPHNGGTPPKPPVNAQGQANVAKAMRLAIASIVISFIAAVTSWLPVAGIVLGLVSFIISIPGIVLGAKNLKYQKGKGIAATAMSAYALVTSIAAIAVGVMMTVFWILGLWFLL